MHGDFTRWTFDADDAYRSVLLQQGRVLLDADWNEQAVITAHHDEVRSADLVGRAGGPLPDDEGGGFAVVDAAGERPDGVSWRELYVTPGRYYVDGILCEAAPPNDPDAPGWPLEDQPHLRTIGDGAAADSGLPEPPDADGDGRYALCLDVWSRAVTGE